MKLFGVLFILSCGTGAAPALPQQHSTVPDTEVGTRWPTVHWSCVAPYCCYIALELLAPSRSNAMATLPLEPCGSGCAYHNSRYPTNADRIQTDVVPRLPNQAGGLGLSVCQLQRNVGR